MSHYKIQLTDIKKIDKNIKIWIVTAEFNKEYSEALEKTNIDFFHEKWFKNIDTYTVPGAFEIPWFATKLLEHGGYDIILAFWVVVRWDTTHYDYVCGETARWIMDLSLTYPTPIIFWLLTCENFEQVNERISNTYAISGINLLSEINRI